jgi:hypothetical protein
LIPLPLTHATTVSLWTSSPHPLSIMISIAFLLRYVLDYIDNHKYTKGLRNDNFFILLCDWMLSCMFQSVIHKLNTNIELLTFCAQFFIDIQSQIPNTPFPWKQVLIKNLVCLLLWFCHAKLFVYRVVPMKNNS